MKNISYWLDIPYTSRPSLKQDIETDVVVVGGGITGVSAAYHSVKAGFRTVLIEKDVIASGSAGKNGGMVVEGLAIDFIEAIKQFGKKQAVEAWQRTIDARECVISLIESNNIACDFSRPGSLYVASEPQDASTLQDELRARHHANFTGEITSQFEPKKDALLVANDCSLHPAKFVRGLVEIAEKAGLSVYEQTPALSFDAHTVTAPHGIIHAKKIVVAIESNKADLAENYGIVKRELALVTEPLSDKNISILSWNKGGMFWETGSNYIAVRRIENRLFINGSINLNPSEKDLVNAQEKIIERFLAFVPSLPKENFIVSHRWTGLLLYPNRNRPFITKQNGYYELFGNGGNGLTNGVIIGKLLVESFLGEDIPNMYQG